MPKKSASPSPLVFQSTSSAPWEDPRAGGASEHDLSSSATLHVALRATLKRLRFVRHRQHGWVGAAHPRAARKQPAHQRAVVAHHLELYSREIPLRIYTKTKQLSRVQFGVDRDISW